MAELTARDAIKAIEKKFGKEVIVSKEVIGSFNTTGILSFDIALGGGLAVGRIIEFYGWESSGKTTLALECIARINDAGGKAAFIDMENAIDLEYAQSLGVKVDFDKDDFILSQPDDGETALELMRELLKSNEIKLIVLDSVGALLPKSVIQGEAGDAKMGVQARLMSQMMPVIAQAANKSGCTIIFINQLREKIGVMFGNPQTTMGGKALGFYASQRVEVIKFGQEKDGDEALANKTRVKVTKNKVGVPFKKAEFLIEFGVGVDKLDDLINIAVQYSVINKAGSWYSYGDTKLGQGVQSVKNILADNPELLEEITNKVIDTVS